MRIALTLIASLLFMAPLAAQPEQVAANTIRAVTKFVLRQHSVDSIIKVISAASTHAQIPTAKAVYDYVQAKGITTTTRLTGTGTSGSPLDIAQQGATVGQVLKWNGTTWVPGDVSGGVSKSYEEFDGVSGSTITTTNTIPATERNWRINLYRDGVRLRYLKDYSISGSVFTLYVTATSENFTLIIEN